MRLLVLIRPLRSAPARRSLATRIWQALMLARSRRALAHLDDHLLADIGLSREDAEAETRRPPWDAPSHWQD
ncbi:MAG: DUF1127 domain-containing protein [Tabrizicola sp.]